MLSISAATGDGVDYWLETLFASLEAGTRIAEVDYDIYAEGEAILGWLNAVVSLCQKFGQGKWKELCEKIMAELGKAFQEAHTDSGHVKIIITNGDNFLMSNLASTAAMPVLHGKLPTDVTDAVMITNARVEMGPQRLEDIVRAALEKACALFAVEATVAGLKSFSPGRPQPTWRYDSVFPKNGRMSKRTS